MRKGYLMFGYFYSLLIIWKWILISRVVWISSIYTTRLIISITISFYLFSPLIFLLCLNKILPYRLMFDKSVTTNWVSSDSLAILFYESAFSKKIYIFTIFSSTEKQTARPKNNINRWNNVIPNAITIIINLIAFTNSDKQNFDFHSSLLSETR